MRTSLLTNLELVTNSKHLREHKTCPKEDCNWENAKDDKAKGRHVWRNHRKWARSTQYPPISGRCDLCGSEFERDDYVPRHKRELHFSQKRVRKEGG